LVTDTSGVFQQIAGAIKAVTGVVTVEAL